MNRDIIRFAQALDFAARTHVNQRRKGEAQEPYLNHLAEVAYLLAEATEGDDVNLVTAGLLHDSMEDQGISYEELVEHFGKDVADLVQEVTDDGSLPEAKRKEMQIEMAPKKSGRAKMLKIADKISNLHSLISSPPVDWSIERRHNYFDWSEKVVQGCRGVNSFLENRFDDALRNR